MGKYMRKAKITGEVAVMEVSHQSTAIGVRTRARTLALQGLQKPSLDSSSYLELRSRRLEKPLAKPKEEFKESPNPNPSPKSGGAANSGANPNPNPKERIRRCEKKEEAARCDGSQEIEVSFGENVLEVESRNVRETTPCSLIRDSETIGTPGSTTRPTNSAAVNRRMQSSIHRNFPTTQEMEEFFAGAERLQQRIFTEKYNFDPIADCPLPGRYEWVKLD